MARETSAPKSDTMTVSGQRKPTARKRAASKLAEEERDEPQVPQALAVPESTDDGLPLSKEEGDDDELHPLPDSASGFRKRSKKDAHVAVKSSSIPNMNVGEVRKALNQIRKAGPAIRMEHLLFNGWPAGRFALAYLKGHHAKRKSTKKGGDEDELEEADEAAGDEGEGEGREAVRAD